jgi:hypothetical protein
MRKLAVAAVSSFVLLLPHAAQAQTESGVDPFLKPAPATERDSGFTLAARFGLGLPMVNALADTSGTATPLGDVYNGQLPIWLDAGYRFASNWFVGAYLQLGIGIVNKDKLTACAQSGNSCKGSDVRLGIEGTYSFSAGRSFNPWIGLGTGYEWANLQSESPTGNGELTFKGWEYFNLQLGGDFTISRVFSLGPYVAFSLAQYQSLSLSGGVFTFSPEIANKKTHAWLQFGVKGTFNL